MEVTYDVTPNGTTSNLSVTDSQPPRVFDEAALQFVKTWRFQPFEISTEIQRVASIIHFEIDPDTEEYVPPPL